MDKNKILSYKNKLIQEKKEVETLLDTMKKNEVINSNNEMAQELSFYDNHPSDSATELFDKEKGIALKKNEMDILNKIDNALKNVENGTYGKCVRCGKDISEERLNFIPYTEYCIDCKKEINPVRLDDMYNRPVEEKSLGKPFGYGYNDYKKSIEFDAEDSYQAVENFNKMENVYDYGDYEYEDEDDIGYVEEVEKISNDQYKNQLPD
ncbi:TraR/DksA C4-type zinc finger protein [Clostridium brassicae]|uniref:TraR/DksA C4-type zinc finger protein n=1 Tax=Clostridium brassicae TaxID=2999072 RepID=A0ABT4DBI1_9CLOT|nr:TraR/DksA C4-type zinc finger protein [Clostridium brassicae]MCY6959647.1 TraR/DksA C4-type zinc finger protein [Clostridium brassicae]